MYKGVRMKVSAMINRKVVVMLLAPVARAVLTLGTGYLSAKGVPADVVGSFADAISIAGAATINVLWELVDRRKAVQAAYSRWIDDIGRANA